MADTKTTALTENTDPLGSDLEYMVDDPAGTPASRKIYKGNNNLLPDGFMVNGKLSVTVSASDLIVALKTKSGSDPSATNPVSIWINGTYRRVTAATSITLADATNWFSLGSSVTATIEQDLFAYLVWDSNSSIVEISCARIPHGRLVSDFSATTTNERYLGNYANFTTTDDVVNIGRFAATLSASAAFTWSVPAFTNLNLIHVPTVETRWLTWAPALTGFSAAPTNTLYKYKIISDRCMIEFSQLTNGTSNATTFVATAPISCNTTTNGAWGSVVVAAVDNGAALTGTAKAQILASAPTAFDLYTTMAGGVWTGSGGKRAIFTLWYQL